MASNYQRGRAKEYDCMGKLEAQGYTCTRSASSKGLWDVVGVRFDGTKLIQIKLTSKGDFSEDENCALLRDLPAHPTTDKELWIYHAGKGLVEVRNLKEPKFDARTADGKAHRDKARERAQQIITSSKRGKHGAKH
jgi:hypothetical protein